LSSPLLDLTDTNRGGWIFAVGLCKQQPVKTYTLAPGVTIDGTYFGDVEVLGRISTLERAFKRIEHTIQNLNLTFPGHEATKQAQEIFADRSCIGWTASGIEMVIVESGLFSEWMPNGRGIDDIFRYLRERPWATNLSKD